MIGVVVSDEQSFAQDRLAIAPRKFFVEIAFAVGNQALEGAQVFFERGDGGGPISFGGGRF